MRRSKCNRRGLVPPRLHLMRRRLPLLHDSTVVLAQSKLCVLGE
uniref:Uncharacterized protein n=1 Tax=Heterorhabditis bacteriophora TaxID=37862 RepID=A0A1I7WNX6_HETBA